MITKNSSGSNISAAFVSAIAGPLVNYRMKLYVSGSELACSIMRASVYLGCADEGGSGVPVGATYAARLDAELYGLSTALAGEEVEVRVGVDVGSGTYEYITVAKTSIITVRTNAAGVTSIQGFGRMVSKLGVTAIGLSAGRYAPSAIASAVNTACGVTVDIGAFPSTSITAYVDAGWTCRQAIASLVLALGGYAYDTNDGKIAVAPLKSASTCSIPADSMTRLPDIDETNYTVDGVIVSVPADDGTSTEYSYGTGRLGITDAHATSATAAALWANLQNYTFRAGTVTTSILDPRITPGDMASVEYGNATVIVPTLGITATYDGGYFGTLIAPGVETDDAWVDGPLMETVATTSRVAEYAKASADAAATAAQEAQTAANAATSAANNAATAASNAQTAADNAATAASNAQTSANAANNAANTALNQLSVIEDVSGALAWISEHGSYVATTDTTVQAGTVYFELQAGEYVPITNPTGNPQAQGWYVLDITDSQSEYIMAHLAVTSEGLWVLPSGIDGQTPATSSGYKALLSNTGMTVYNASGIAVANYGSSVTVGQVGAAHTSISPDETIFYDADANEAAKISMSAIGAMTTSVSYSITTTTSWITRTEEGITPVPDFSLGNLVLTVYIDGAVARVQNIASLTEPQISFVYDTWCDVTFQASGDSESWTAQMEARGRNVEHNYEVVFGLEWEYTGRAPMFSFGSASNSAAYTFSAGNGNELSDEGSSALGLGLIANRQAQVVLGRYNKPNQYAELILGDGTSDASRANSLEVDYQGNLKPRGYMQNGGTVNLDSGAQTSWLAALGLSVETIYETADITIKRFGRMVMVQCHGIYATPGSGNAWANIDLSDYKPSYNVSTLLADASGSAHFARLWVSASNGKVYLAIAGYSSAANWYGTLTYIY